MKKPKKKKPKMKGPLVNCGWCDGTGFVEHQGGIVCDRCGGSGKIEWI